jgi:hypothetical protein
MNAADLPDMSNGVAGIAYAGDRPAALHGVVFDIFGWERDIMWSRLIKLPPAHVALTGTRISESSLCSSGRANEGRAPGR